MTKYLIEGGHPLHGTIEISGAKNAAVPIIPAALLVDGVCRIENVPQISDVTLILQILRELGADVRTINRTTVEIDCSHIRNRQVPYELARKIRASYYLVGALLGRFGWAEVPLPGGCNLGGRPIDQHIKGFVAMGAEVDVRNGLIYAQVPGRGCLAGGQVYLDIVSVGATMNIMLAAVLAEGKTELSGAATEPEIMDLVCVLQKMGAIISVDVDRTFRIEGVKELQGYTHTSLTDRIEAASWASAALATHGDIFVKGATQPEMMTFLNVFRKIGGEFDITDKGIRFWHPGGDLKPVAIETDVHPGFMTDWQQPLVVALTQANGLSIVHETVYENRFGFTKPLVEMGATIQLYRECLGSLPCRFRQRNYKHSAVIFGPTPLTGRDIDVPDLRGGFSHLIAALAAKGPSNVQGISLIDRGYADFRGKLEALGADFD